MSDRVDVSSRIKVTDEASGTIAGIQRAFASMRQQALSVGEALRSTFNKGAFGGITANLRGVHGAFAKLGAQARGIIAPLTAIAGIAGGFSLSGAVSSVDEFAKSTLQLAKTAALLRTNVSELDALHYAAERSRVSAETFDEAMKRADLNLAKAASGGGKDLASLFKALRIPMKDAAGNMRPMTSMLDQFADKVAKQKNTGTQLMMLTALFGKQGKEMLQFFSGGSAQIEKFKERARELSVRTEADVALAKRYVAAQKSTKEELGDLGEEISRTLLPAFIPFLEIVSELVKQNKEPILKAFRENAEGVVQWLSKIDVKQLSKDMGEWYRWIVDLTSKIGGWKTVLAGAAAVLAGPLLAAIAGITVAVAALGAAVVTNPAALAIAGLIAGVGYLAYRIYTDWEPLKGYVRDFFRDMDKSVRQSTGELEQFGADFKADPLKASLGALRGWWNQFWEGIETDLGPIKDALEKHGYSLGMSAEPLKEAWGKITGFFDETWSAVKTSFGDAETALGEFVTKYTPQSIKDAWSGLTSFFNQLWGGIVGAFNWAWEKIEPLVKLITDAARTIGNLIPSFGGGNGAPVQLPLMPPLPPANMPSLVPPAGFAPTPGIDTIPKAMGAGAGPATVRGDVDVTVNIKTDPGATATTKAESSGQVNTPQVNVGRTMEAAG